MPIVKLVCYNAAMKKIIISTIGLVIILAVVYGLTSRNMTVSSDADNSPNHPVTSTSTNGAPINVKINIDYVCRNALSYMSFPDAASAEVFVQDCKDGKHPEVIEKYKQSLNLSEGVAI